VSSDPYSLTRQAVEKHSGFTCHALRRAFAVRWLAGGGSESGLMRIAGWSSSEMIRTYVRARADELAQDEMRRLLA
jgi:integrase